MRHALFAVVLLLAACGGEAPPPQSEALPAAAPPPSPSEQTRDAAALEALGVNSGQVRRQVDATLQAVEKRSAAQQAAAQEP